MLKLINMVINQKRLEELARQKEDENREFRIFIRGCNPWKVDNLVRELNNKYFSSFDCRNCGNCCRNLSPRFTRYDIKRIAEQLGISINDFKNKYVSREQQTGFALKGESCPFLDGNTCTIYSVRPDSCRSYPHLTKKMFNHRFLEMIDNTYICPIVYNVIEDLKAELW
ncbi:YkgJ family cysteine cluster protein [Halothermothrix orenii]|uniref:YkgJ family cysteine cluster protein n=1 Tax=Halothermothrix orenii TaxID=31909 RepID=UPI00030D5B60|nr:YkgJ family cysteine cluster protein [Halothermothrix orenii]